MAKDHSPIDAMCEVTGGRSYSVTSQRVLHQCIDSLVQKLQSGVVIHFEKIGPDPPPLPNSAKDSDVIDVDNPEDLAKKGLRRIQIEGDEQEYLLDGEGNIYNLQGEFVGTTGEDAEEMEEEGEPDEQ